MTLVHKVIGDNPDNVIGIDYNFPKRFISITSGAVDGSRVGVSLEISRTELRELIHDLIRAYKDIEENGR